MAESLCYPSETITTLLTGYTPIQNKKLKKRICISVSYPSLLLLHDILEKKNCYLDLAI